MHYLQIQNVKRNSVKVAEPSDEHQEVIVDSPKEEISAQTEAADFLPNKSDSVNTEINNVSTLNHNPLNSHSDIFDTVTEITNENK